MTGRTLLHDGPARLLARAEVARVLDALAAPGEETRLVGGCVRDALVGIDSADLDLATSLEPTATLSLAAKGGLRAIPTGFDHGTVTLLVDGIPFEVTTLREDIETDGRHAVVRFGRDFARDAERRDFTINALSLDAAGTIHDTTGGVSDLGQGRVRFIGEAGIRIREDALRILRFFRFHARYGLGDLDEDGLSACIAARDLIGGLSRERVRAELLKLLVAPGVTEALAAMERAGILARLLAGPADLDRLTRLIKALPQATGPVRLAALAVSSDADIPRLQEALRLSKAEVSALSAYAAALASLKEGAEIDLYAMRGLAADHDAGPLVEALAALEAGARPRISDDALALLEAVRAGRTQRPVFPIAGADLVRRGVPPGPAIGRGLSAARALWLERGCPDDAAGIEALIDVGSMAARTQG